MLPVTSQILSPSRQVLAWPGLLASVLGTGCGEISQQLLLIVNSHATASYPGTRPCRRPSQGLPAPG
jgi:hypothetical protein